MPYREITSEQHWANQLSPDNRPKDKTKQSFGYKTLLDKAFWQVNAYRAIQILAGVLIAGYGAMMTGSYTISLTGRMTGLLAVLFYHYQFGTVLVVIGAIVAYDALKRY
jgi:hypothetical protein